MVQDTERSRVKDTERKSRGVGFRTQSREGVGFRMQSREIGYRKE